MSWTRAAVMARLVEAERVTAATVTHSMGRSRSMDVPPHVQNHVSEISQITFERDRWDFLKQEGFVSADGGTVLKPIPWRWKLDTTPERASIDRATEAMRWPVLYVKDERERMALLAFIIHRAYRGRGHGFTALVNARLKVAWHAPISKTRAHWLKDHGLLAIADGLNAAKVPMSAIREAA